VAGIAHLVFGVGVPGGVERVNLVGDLVHLDRKADVVEEEELGLGPEVGHIADARGLQIGLGLFGGAARVSVIGFAGVGLHDRAMHAHGLFRIERVHVGAVGVGHQLHVGLVDGLPAGDRRAVEHLAFFERVVVERAGRDRDVLLLAFGVDKAVVDEFDFFFFDQAEDVSGGHRSLLS